MDLENLETQSLLDPADTSLDFISRKDGPGRAKPIAIYHINESFLLCYDKFAIFVNKNGWRVKHDWMISWKGLPQRFGDNIFRNHNNTDFLCSGRISVCIRV